MIFDQTSSAKTPPNADRIETFDRYLACVISRTSKWIARSPQPSGVWAFVAREAGDDEQAGCGWV